MSVYLVLTVGPIYSTGIRCDKGNTFIVFGRWDVGAGHGSFWPASEYVYFTVHYAITVQATLTLSSYRSFMTCSLYEYVEPVHRFLEN